MPVRPSELVRQEFNSARFVPGGEFRAKASDFDYIEEEWFARGEDARGRPYRTQIFIRRPRNPAKFSGTVIVEPLHIHRLSPIYMFCSSYILRAGHGWACVVSQKTALDAHVKPSDPEHYASLTIATEPGPDGAPTDLLSPPFRGFPDAIRGAWWQELGRYNEASSTILAQVGAALRNSAGPFAGYALRHLLLGGHSQTGFVTTNFLREAHHTQRRSDGAPVYDGFFPSGFPATAFGPCDVPIVQTLSDGDVSNPRFTFQPGYEDRQYRRPDSDDREDRYRLYELAGMAHVVTRLPPFNDPAMWQDVATAIPVPLDSVMNSLPQSELFDMTLHHLVEWVAHGAAPPRADRIAVGADGYFAKDEHGNSIGGVRCAQLDVPRATYLPNPLYADGTPSFGTAGIELAFDAAKMRRLYGTPANYVAHFHERLDALVGEGWFLAEEVPEMRAEAEAQRW